MISSGPGQFRNREVWRGRTKDRREVKIIFLIAKPQEGSEGLQKYLEEEAAQFGDILQSDIVDGHRRLGYKILTGYVWSYLWCSEVGMVAKTDDNVVVDLESLLTTPSQQELGRRVLCGSGTPHRNMKPLRSDRTHMTGNWSISREQLSREFHPDFCSGFLYLTSPQGDNRPAASVTELLLRRIFQLDPSWYRLGEFSTVTLSWSWSRSRTVSSRGC